MDEQLENVSAETQLTQAQLDQQLAIWNLVIKLEAKRLKFKLPVNWLRQQLKRYRKSCSREKSTSRLILKNAIKMNDANLVFWVSDIVNLALVELERLRTTDVEATHGSISGE